MNASLSKRSGGIGRALDPRGDPEHPGPRGRQRVMSGQEGAPRMTPRRPLRYRRVAVSSEGSRAMNSAPTQPPAPFSKAEAPPAGRSPANCCFVVHPSFRLSKRDRLVASYPRPCLGRAVGSAPRTWSGRDHASVAALRPQALSRPSGARPGLVRYKPSPHPPRVRRRRRTSCCVSFRRPHPQRTFSTLPVRPPHLPCMRPIGAGTRLPPLRSGRQITLRSAENFLGSRDPSSFIYHPSSFSLSAGAGR